MFYDRNPDTGAITPTSYESMRAAVLGAHLISDSVPEHIRKRLFTAVDFIALAYEQGNRERQHRFAPLTRSAVTMSLLAIELALKDRLQTAVDKHMTPGPLINQARDAGLLISASEQDEL